MATDYSWLAAVDDTSPVGLTIRAQNLPILDDEGLPSKYQTFMPEDRVSSVKIREMTSLDNRFEASNRAWNAYGRYIPIHTPRIDEIEMVPTEARTKIQEREMQELVEVASRGGNSSLIQNEMGISVPARVDSLVSSIRRAKERQFAESWATGAVTVRDPENSTPTTFSYGFPAGRFQTAGTAWDDAGQNAYNNFITWYRDGQNTMGAGVGVICRQATLLAILADAPTIASTGLVMTQGQVEAELSQVLGNPINFRLYESTYDRFDDGGVDVTRVTYWPAQVMAMIPAGQTVGRTAVAPNIRAYDMAASLPAGTIDVNGISVYYDEHANGRELEIEAQQNFIPIPDEGKMWVIDTGV